MLPFILGVLVAVLLGLSVYATARARKRDQELIERREQERRTQRFTTGLPEVHLLQNKNTTGCWQLLLDGQSAVEPTDPQELTDAVESLGVTAGYLTLTPPKPIQDCLYMRATPDPDGGLAVQVTMQADNSSVVTLEKGALSRPQAAKLLITFWQGSIPVDVNSWQPI